MSLEVYELVFLVIGTAAACIAAAPVVSSWIPIRLSSKERLILQMSISNDVFNGIIQHNLEPKSTVQVPFQHAEQVEVSQELLELRDKGLVRPINTNVGQPAGTIWYQITEKGYKLTKTKCA
ncbi:hypothetical protein F9L16_23405 [Agarivorans sp. B2Z047]|uniref:hypothetical protein n=1 Tax=Agarivorans sp. B2Z047 TaxID=2652721 RepID=UPI00128DDB05|nr:hypothetical protein [Agarivorans sp. B2Z047]MPW31906.1 hypothetical protein [Agarivorans sp. B2Z047]UQN44872.1 hypothetical protein LQZ07_10530 [Agarivorans sp. B2Z047]